jgi:hypothetical protein
MDRMHPEDIEDLESATAGERKGFRYLQAVARPDSEKAVVVQKKIKPGNVCPPVFRVFYTSSRNNFQRGVSGQGGGHIRIFIPA